MSNPGSMEALRLGCLCPVLDNSLVLGYTGGVVDGNGNVVFVVNEECPLHGATYIDEELSY
ncbi:hypothetical protein G7B40_040355 [Aetokthonos hydrillicola Thurmond2011]|jgi:hypothetical protein|uniref:Uncharacterized protein n=1 Tax=Aetokthonos hydrillicola Thurmond2011 TaxID=2712845 RepID=A0AAP5M729_9CYAN|nr:hypothetical protein [Aetokthonos hydrillicola]MDR9893282.1 hypothetical protein [Aetokthonos hydrillicola Thurmond2011]MDR9900741.1 hypothetical protein [Aetokthonos hydrillicola Thurmond2011]